MSDRLSQLQTWLYGILTPTAEDQISLSPVAGDASFRRYFRAKQEGSEPLIVMDAPPEKEDCVPFVRITEEWHKQGVRVPRLFAKDLEQGFLLLEDFGDIQMLDTVINANEESKRNTYSKALSALEQIQALPAGDYNLPPYNEALLVRELGLFTEWLIGTALKIKLSPPEQNIIEAANALLIDSALQQPQCVVHRDYHSRNLMMCDDNTIGIIDFQDAVLGPVTYDLVSLLRDCYIELDPELIKNLCLEFKSNSPLQIIREMDAEHFRRNFDLMGIQRHMKAAGIFARLALRDGKYGYLKDIPRTFNYITRVSAYYPELADFSELLEKRIEAPMRDFVAKTLDGQQAS